MSINANTLFSLLESQMGRDALASAMLTYLAPSVSPVKASHTSSVDAPGAPVKAKKTKKEKDPLLARPEPTEWVLFSGRVRSIIGAETGAKVPGKVWMQVSSSLKDAGLMSSATDEQVLAAYKTYLASPPEKSKAFTQGLSKAAKKAATSVESSSTTSVSKALDFAEPVAASEPVAAEKPKRQGRKKIADMTPEERAAHEAKKAAKKGAMPPPLPPSPSPAEPEDEDWLSPDSKIKMDFEPFVWKKLDLLKNSLGHVLTEEMSWFGNFVDGKMDTTAEPPFFLDYINQ